MPAKDLRTKDLRTQHAGFGITDKCGQTKNLVDDSMKKSVFFIAKLGLDFAPE